MPCSDSVLFRAFVSQRYWYAMSTHPHVSKFCLCAFWKHKIRVISLLLKWATSQEEWEREQNRKIVMRQERSQTQGAILPLWWKICTRPQKGLAACQVFFLCKQTARRTGQETLAPGGICFRFLLLSRGTFSPRFGDQGKMPYWKERHQAELTFLSTQIPKWVLWEVKNQIKQPVTFEITFFIMLLGNQLWQVAPKRALDSLRKGRLFWHLARSRKGGECMQSTPVIRSSTVIHPACTSCVLFPLCGALCWKQKVYGSQTQLLSSEEPELQRT